MIWLDVLIGVLALVVLGLVCFSLYKHGKALTRALGESSTRIANASADLNAQQAKAAARS
ncbi:MAG: hypothetical protein JWO12_844 [Frankiales bacterium]|nr:hypothetical protein [Frankiales bacterium]